MHVVCAEEAPTPGRFSHGSKAVCTGGSHVGGECGCGSHRNGAAAQRAQRGQVWVGLLQ